MLAAFTGQWGSLGRALLGAVALGAVYSCCTWRRGARSGFGDVRLAVLLGLFLGWLGWAEVVWGALLPWLVNVPVVLVALLTGRAGRKSRLPFGPAMLAGALLAIAVPPGSPAAPVGRDHRPQPRLTSRCQPERVLPRLTVGAACPYGQRHWPYGRGALTGGYGIGACQNADSKVVRAGEVWREFPLPTNRYLLVGTGPPRKEGQS